MSIWFDGDFAIHRIGYLQTQLQMDWELQPKLHVTKKLFQTKFKKKTIMEIFISDCLVFFSYGSHFFEGNTCSLVFCSVVSYKILVPKTCRGRVAPCFALVFRQS